MASKNDQLDSGDSTGPSQLLVEKVSRFIAQAAYLFEYGASEEDAKLRAREKSPFNAQQVMPLYCCEGAQ